MYTITFRVNAPKDNVVYHMPQMFQKIIRWISLNPWLQEPKKNNGKEKSNTKPNNWRN